MNRFSNSPIPWDDTVVKGLYDGWYITIDTNTNWKAIISSLPLVTSLG